MKSDLHVASPPAKPLMIFDGDCNFCRLWIRRWQIITGDRIDYLPFQDPSFLARFPDLPAERVVAAVHLIESDGCVSSGAEAAFRTLAYNPRKKWLLHWYEHLPAFAGVTEWGYRLVAGHRSFFSRLTRLGWGQHTEPSSHLLLRWVFLRSLGLIYLAAFLSLWTQISGLIGGNGIQPAQMMMESMRQEANVQNIGLDRYRRVPTFCWFNASDGFLKAQCAAGTALAVALIIGLGPAPCLFLLWLIYLSLSTACGVFCNFQWDVLLLEVGFLAIFFAPLQLRPGLAREAPPSHVVLWLFRWLLFRLMFESGSVKLLSHDRSWQNLSALNVHYETQPLPTWIGWYAHQFPAWVQQASTVLMFAIELAAPFLIFAPRRLRHFGCAALVALQVLILLTGNYCFFNLLTLALCLLLLDDAALGKMAFWRRRQNFGGAMEESMFESVGGMKPLSPALSPSERERESGGRKSLDPRPATFDPRKWPRWLTIPLACVVVAISLVQLSGMFRLPRWSRPGVVTAVYEWLAPFRGVNTYGLFAVMTTSRLELVIEGSSDGKTWLPYEFKYKPGDLKRRPGFVAPHQPRLDWQMWFAALGSYQNNPWLVNLSFRLLQGSPQVIGLLGRNPFPHAPPRYVRAVGYDYHFTDFATRRKTGAWWRREVKGLYLPAISLPPVDKPQASNLKPQEITNLQSPNSESPTNRFLKFDAWSFSETWMLMLEASLQVPLRLEV